MSDLECTCTPVDPEESSGLEHDPDCPEHGDPVEWCPECGTGRHIADQSWEVDVSRDGPDGPEWLVAVLDCDHELTVAGPRSQRSA